MLSIAEVEAAGTQDLGVTPWRRVDADHNAIYTAALCLTGSPPATVPISALNQAGGIVPFTYILSLVPSMLSEALTITDMRGRINYGIEGVRYITPVPVGSRIRTRATLLESEKRSAGLLYQISVEVEIDGGDTPALAGVLLFLVF
jgi:hypothetical protein